MPKALTLKQAWIRALESGEYKQARKAWMTRSLDQKTTTEFCCLSVLYAVQHGEKPACGYINAHDVEQNSLHMLGNKVTWDMVAKNDEAEWTFPMIAEYLKRNTRILKGVLLDVKV